MKTTDRLVYLATFAPLYLFLVVGRVIPFRVRVAIGGALFGFATRFAPPVRNRILENLSLVRPEMTGREARAFCGAVGRQLGRTMTEILYGAEHQRKHLPFRVDGPGLDALRAARDAGRPVVLVSAHFGQWDAARMYLRDAEGIEVGALYRPSNNPYYEPFFVAGVKASGEPLIPKGRAGFRDLISELKKGRVMAILTDQHQANGVMLPFLGHDAKTPLTAAELALKFKAPLVPVFGVRHDAAGEIAVTFHAPIPPGTTTEMMRAFNDLASRQIDAHPDQWLWPHRRWKG